MRKGNFSEDDINNAKQLIVETVRSISGSQDGEITYYYGQELSDVFTSIDEYISEIQHVNKTDIEEIAKQISINTIYFLRD